MRRDGSAAGETTVLGGHVLEHHRDLLEADAHQFGQFVVDRVPHRDASVANGLAEYEATALLFGQHGQLGVVVVLDLEHSLGRLMGGRGGRELG